MVTVTCVSLPKTKQSSCHIAELETAITRVQQSATSFGEGDT
jgi:hypothetical protein